MSYRSVFFPAKTQIKLISRCFEEVNFFPSICRLPCISRCFDEIDFFTVKKSTLVFIPVYKCRRLFSRQNPNKNNLPVFWRIHFFPSICLLPFISRGFDEIDFFPLYPCISASVFFPAKKSNALYPPVFWSSRLFLAKKSITVYISRYFDEIDFFPPKSWLSYLYPCISASVFFPTKKSNALYPPVFWSSSEFFPLKSRLPFISRCFDEI